ncbi:MAG: hypothetical protein ACM30I_06820 [Gemmatimonas sp.]
MATTREGHLAKIARLMRDPRYWNKKDPEHPQVFAESQRAFAGAYPELAPETDTSPGTVHVRAYTRTVDGKEVPVSAYDRTQLVAMRGSPPPSSGLREDVENAQSNNAFHDAIVDDLANGLAAAGADVAKEMKFTSLRYGMWSATPDLFVRGPDGLLYLIEVKTGKIRPHLNMRQRVVYRALADGEAFTDDPRIRQFGFVPGWPVPPVCVYSLWARWPGDVYKIDVMAGGRKCEADLLPQADGPALKKPI